MDQKPNAPSKYTTSLIVVIVLTIAFLLSCILTYKLFLQGVKHHFAHRILSLPKIKDTNNLSKIKTDGWQIVYAQPGDTLSTIFKKMHLSRQSLQSLLNKNPHAKHFSNIKQNQEIKFLIENNTLQKLILPISLSQFIDVTYKDKRYHTEIKTKRMDSHEEYLTATIQGSLYGTAKKSNIPYNLIRKMTEIFNWEIDFAKEVRTGDQFSILYQAYYIENKLVNTGEILAVTYRQKDKAHEAIRFSNGSGGYDYYNPKGISLKKAFSRYPIRFSHISSTYSLSRYHPILHYRRPHYGIDLAAAIGTPVHATGDGRIAIINKHSGYGNMVKLVHNNIYSSIYAHLLRFQKGLSKGDYVRRGDVIGYVGQTGLADGPHCHYEFHVKQQPKNPATVELPRAASVSRRAISSFRTKAHTLLAQLKLFEDAQLAALQKKQTKHTA